MGEERIRVEIEDDVIKVFDFGSEWEDGWYYKKFLKRIGGG